MKRSGFASKWTPRPARQWTGPMPTARKVVSRLVDACRSVVSVPKETAIQNQAYMAAVRKLACARCWTTAVPRQFCHADEGKGEKIKTDCRRGWPGCAECHHFVGMTGRMGKEGRREFESFAGACTRQQIEEAGQWPARLPRWEQ